MLFISTLRTLRKKKKIDSAVPCLVICPTKCEHIFSKSHGQNFPGGPMAETPLSLRRGSLPVQSLMGELDPTCHN